MKERERTSERETLRVGSSLFTKNYHCRKLLLGFVKLSSMYEQEERGVHKLTIVQYCSVDCLFEHEESQNREVGVRQHWGKVFQ